MSFPSVHCRMHGNSGHVPSPHPLPAPPPSPALSSPPLSRLMLTEDTRLYGTAQNAVWLAGQAAGVMQVMGYEVWGGRARRDAEGCAEEAGWKGTVRGRRQKAL